MNEEQILAIIKAILPIVESIVIADVKPQVITWLEGQIEHKQKDIATENVTILHAKFGQGLWKDEGRLAVYEGELAGLNWALAQINAFQPTQA